MNVLRDIFNFYINSSIHVALSVCAFTAITFEIFQEETNLNLICFIFFGTVTGYNFVKYAGIAQLHHRSLTTALQTIQYFSLLCFFCCIYFTFKVGWNVLLGCLPLGLLTLFYAVPLFSSQNLRTAPTIKIFVIAAVWAGATVYLPKIILDLDWGMEIAMILMQRFLFVLALILPFEIRDLAHDDKKLATLPQLLGIQKTKMVGYSILIMAGVLNLAYNRVNDLPVVAVFIILTGSAIYYSKKLQNKYYASFWVEGIPIYCWVISLFI